MITERLICILKEGLWVFVCLFKVFPHVYVGLAEVAQPRRVCNVSQAQIGRC